MAATPVETTLLRSNVAEPVILALLEALWVEV